VAEWGALLRRCSGKPDRGFKSLPLRQPMRSLCCFGRKQVAATVVAITLAFAFASAPVSISGSPASAAACTRQHSAKPNDSWSRLAARFKLSLRELLAMNSASTRTAIFIGDTICVSQQPIVTQQPTVTKPTDSYTRRQVVAIIREVWPDEHEENALLVARRESRYVPTAIGGTRNCCYGLFQMYWSVHRSWLAKSGITEPSQLLDPRTNAEAALALFRRNGNSWRPWWTSSWRP
jgi:LysM repeat protein